MNKKNGKNNPTGNKTQDVEYSRHLTPSMGRVREAGYGKTTDLELAELGKYYGYDENQNKNRGFNMEVGGEINPIVTGIHGINVKKPDQNYENQNEANQNYEFGNLNTENNQNQANQNFELGNIDNAMNQNENDNAGLNQDLAGGVNGTGDITNNPQEMGTTGENNFEFGDLDKKDKSPTANPDKEQTQK